MRTISRIFSIFAVAVATPAAAASVTVGSNDSGNCYPFTCNDSGTSVGQSIDYYQIYNSSAFSGATSFNKINFFEYAPIPGNFLSGNYVIDFATTISGIGSGYPVLPLSNISNFFNGSLGGPSNAGVFSITGGLYNYNPANGNLVMHVIASNQALVPNGSGNGYLQADYTGTNTTRAYLLSSGTPSSGTGALVTEFVTTSAVPEPATWVMMLVGFGMVGFSLRSRRKQTVRVTYA